jgi:tetratricopeptide (TPR) repeat protein
MLQESSDTVADLDQDGSPDPGGLPIKTWIAKAFLERGERGEAKKLLMLASVENPEDMETVRLLEEIKREDVLNNAQMAKEDMKETDLSSPFSGFNACMALAYLGRNDNLPSSLRSLGEKFLDYAIEINPRVANAHLLKAWYLRDRGETKQAIASTLLALAVDPDYAKAWSGLGFFLMESNQFVEAAGAFNKTLELYPGCPQRKTIIELISGIQQNAPFSTARQNDR